MSVGTVCKWLGLENIATYLDSIVIDTGEHCGCVGGPADIIYALCGRKEAKNRLQSVLSP